MSSLIDWIIERNWEEACRDIDANPEKASIRDEENNLPIHIALETVGEISDQSPQSLLIRKLLKHFPASVRETNENGLIPAHFVNVLDVENFITILTLYPAGAMTFDNSKNLPLHYAVSGQCPLDKVKPLVKLHKAGVKEKNANGFTPIELAYEQRKQCENFKILNYLLKASWAVCGAEKNENTRTA